MGNLETNIKSGSLQTDRIAGDYAGQVKTDNCTVMEYYHCNKALEIRDLFKFIYQSAFGCEHLVSDYDRALQWIMSESETAEADDLPVVEFLDGEYCRVHLKCMRSSEAKETLCRLFLQSSRSHPEGRERLERMLEELKEYLPSSENGFTREQLLDEIEKWRSAGYPAIHHSDAFRDTHHPAYRVIKKEYLAELRAFICYGNITT